MTHLLHILAQQSGDASFLLPRTSSNLARDFNSLWYLVLGVTTFFFCIVITTLTIFLIKYRRRSRTDKTSDISHNTPLEITWTTIPLILVITFFYLGFKGFVNYDTPPSNAIPIEVVAKKWQYTFNYPNGATDGALYVEKGVPVVLNIRSIDVLHAVYIPAFRIQRNAVPGRVTQLWFIPEETSPAPLGSDPGGFPLVCTQYCGEQHSKMVTRVHVLEKADFDKKMIALANPFKETDPVTGKSRWIPYAQLGEKFYKNYGCSQCHSVDGSKSTGPTWKGLWKCTVDFSVSNDPGFSLGPSDPDAKWEAYIRESILEPQVKIVSGYQNQMPQQPQFAGTESNNEKLRAIIEYIKSLGTVPYKPAASTQASPDLFNADENHPVHPESLAAQKNRTAPQNP